MTETLTAPAPAAGPADPNSNVLRLPEGIEALPSTPPETSDLRMVLITGTRPPLVSYNEQVLKHRVMALRRSTAYPETFTVFSGNFPHVADFAYGALMNPTPVEGAFYMHPVNASTATVTGVDHGLHYVSQYRDGEWRIVLPVNSDNTVMWFSQATGSDDRPQTPYYRVKAPLDLIPEGWAYTPDDVTEITDPSTQMVLRGREDAAPAPEAPEENPIPANLRPHAADGAVLNETREPGVLYALTLYGEASTVVEFAYPSEHSDTDWYVSHDLSTPAGGEVQVNGRRMHRHMVISTSASTWVRAKTVTVEELTSTEGVGAAARLASLRLEAADLTSRWEAYEESLNGVADENDWCPDYERILEPLGMTGRTEKKQRTGTVDVTLSWEGEWESTGISSHQDLLIGEALNFEHPGSVSISRAALDLSGRVTIRRTGIPVDSDGDPESNDSGDLNIDSDDVASAVTLHTGGTLEVEEFAVESVRFISFDD